MIVRRAISEIEGIADPKTVKVLKEIKAVVEHISGRLPNNQPLKLLGANATPQGTLLKVNEILSVLQDHAYDTQEKGPIPSTNPTVDSIFFFDASTGGMGWLTLAGGSLQITGTTLDTLNGIGCLRGPGTAS